MKNKKRFLFPAVASLLLLIPLTAMQFTDAVTWTLTDFVVAALLLLSAGWAIDYAGRKVKDGAARATVSLLILAVLFLIWAELAVGIFGTPLAGH